VVAGREIRSGMVYSGRGLTAVNGYDADPALIDPTLRVNWRNPDTGGHRMGYWPSYSRIAPESRAAYLQWLAGGRSDPLVGVGYVFLFFYGLERRVLYDVKLDPTNTDVAAAVREVERLQRIYGHSGSFNGYATSFLEFVDAGRIASVELTPADVSQGSRHWQLPLALRAGIAQRAARREPLSPEWALAWLRADPNAYLRTPANRCPDEFDSLFTHRYRERFGDGIALQPTKKRIEIEYRPASAGFSGRVEATLGDLPDVTSSEAILIKLREVAEECVDDLGAYSRYLGRNPESQGEPGAVALLPRTLIKSHGGNTVESLDRFAAAELGNENFATVALDELVAAWAPADAGEKLGKPQAVSLAALLGNLGYGMEPDVRFGAPKPKPGEQVVLFRLAPDAPAAPSLGFTEAALLVRLSGLLAAADGTVSEDERRLLAEHLEASVGLEPPERARVEASLVWLGTTGQTLAGLKKKVEGLGAAERETLGHFLINVAGADGHISPDEITTLIKLYRLLGLEEAAVYSTIHALEVGGDAPVTVREADPDSGRRAIPEPAIGVTIDASRLSARRAETAQVAALLGSVFSEDEPADGHDAGARQEPPESVLPGLDASHAALALAFGTQSEWTPADLAQLVGDHGLPLADAVVDRINDAVIEICGEPLLDGDGPWDVNTYALQEIS
jgi:tellurite resistance protein